MDSRLSETVHILPGIVQKYYPTTQSVDVQLATTDPLVSITDGSVTYDIPALVPQAKVLFPGGGGFTISWPLLPGDHVTCLFFDLYVEDYRQTGQQSNPTLIGKHAGYTCVVLPGSCADASIAKSAPTTAMVVGVDNDPAQIVLAPGSIKLGATAADFVALASKVDAALTTIQATLNGGIAITGVTPGSGTGAAAFVTPLGAINPTGSTLVGSA
jgi:hypothetical protein